MASEEDRPTGRYHDLESISALLLDPQAASGSKIKDRMIDVGLRGIATCEDVDALAAQVQENQPDLLVLDLDDARAAICKAIQQIRNQAIKNNNPFAVIIGVTDDSGRETVAAALDAGVDAMLAKPVSPSTMRNCLREQIDNRADFIATADYIGPDRRPEDREPSDEELVSVEVPNTLQQKATGEESDQPVEDRIAETMRSLGAQRAWHLARRAGVLAENARRAMASGQDFPLLGECVEAIDGIVGDIESLDAELNLSSLRGVVASARTALEALNSAGDQIDARHFELLRVHCDSVGLAMEEDDSIRDVLVTELGRAVSAVRGEPLPAIDPTSAPGQSGKHSWKVRFKAWWEGVEPEDVIATRQASQT